MLYIIIGLAAGVLAGLFGIGGGVVIVPALLFVSRMTPLTATGTSLGAWEYYRTGNLDIRAALIIAIGLFFGAFFGARIAHILTAIQLKRAFAVFLVLVAVRIWTTK